MATELTDLIRALGSLYHKNDDIDIKRAILLLGDVIKHQVEPSDRDLNLLGRLIAEIQTEEEEEEEEDESSEEEDEETE